MSNWAIPALVVAIFEIARLVIDLRKQGQKLQTAETDMRGLADRVAAFHESLVEVENRQQTRYMAMLEQQTVKLAESYESVTKVALEAILDVRQKVYPEPPPADVGEGDIAGMVERELDMIRQVEANPRQMDEIVDGYLETIRGLGDTS